MSHSLIIALLFIKVKHSYRIFKKIIMMLGKPKGGLFKSVFLECLLVSLLHTLFIETNRTYGIFRKNIMMGCESKGDLFSSIFLECLSV